MSAATAIDSRRARAAIFQRLREAPVPAVAVPDVSAYFRERAHASTDSGASRIERFVTQARAWRTEVIETDSARWPAQIAAMAQSKNLRHVLAGRGTLIADRLSRSLGSRLNWYDEDIARFKPILFDGIDAGITTVRGGVAETGSLILWPCHREPRTLSLVPPVHIAILHASRVVETLYDAVSDEHWAAGMPANALLISGPSRTSDIQRTLAYGAHGPKELIVLLVRDDRVAAPMEDAA